MVTHTIPAEETPVIKQHRIPEPCTVIVFGAAGDLVIRKLMPSLFHLTRGEHLPEQMLFIGVDRVDTNTEAYRKEVAKGQARAPGLQTMMLPKPKDWDAFLKNVHYFRCDLAQPKELASLGEYVDKLEKEQGITN